VLQKKKKKGEREKEKNKMWLLCKDEDGHVTTHKEWS
jgi:hypothetical protein